MYKKVEKLYISMCICIKISVVYLLVVRASDLIKLDSVPIISFNTPAKPMVLVTMLKSCGFFMSAICLNKNEGR